MLVKRTITLGTLEAEVPERQIDRDNKQVISKNYSTFTDCISEINNIKVNNVQDPDVVMTMYNLI